MAADGHESGHTTGWFCRGGIDVVNIVVMNEAKIWSAWLVFAVDEDFFGGGVFDVHGCMSGRGSRRGGGDI